MGIYRWPVDSPQNGQRDGALKFSLTCAWTNGLANDRDASDLGRHCAHYYATVMCLTGLTHCGRVPHICVSKLTIAWTAPSHYLNHCRNIVNWTLRNRLQKISIDIQIFSFKKIHFKMSSGKWRPSCLGLNVLIQTFTCDGCSGYKWAYSHLWSL